MAPHRARFLASQGLAPETLQALPSDASPRRYFRLQHPSSSLLLMQAPPDSSDYLPFLRIADHLRGLGLSTPEVLACDEPNGLALVEDFGSGTFQTLLKAGHSEQGLYELAIDAMVHLHDQSQATAIDLPLYGDVAFEEEAGLFCDWFVPNLMPEANHDEFRTAYLNLWKQALASLRDNSEALVLRDFHVDNLMRLEGRDGIAACGLLDFQDALLGPASYDLVSLTQDARRDLKPGLEAHLIDRYLAARPHLDRQTFLKSYFLMAAHRHTKVAGIFIRLAVRDRKPAYLVHMPRVLSHLEKALKDAGLCDLNNLMDQLPQDWRNWSELSPPLASRINDNIPTL